MVNAPVRWTHTYTHTESTNRSERRWRMNGWMNGKINKTKRLNRTAQWNMCFGIIQFNSEQSIGFFFHSVNRTRWKRERERESVHAHERRREVRIILLLFTFCNYKYAYECVLRVLNESNCNELKLIDTGCGVLVSSSHSIYYLRVH